MSFLRCPEARGHCRRRSRAVYLCALLGVLAVAPAAVRALPDDQEQPIHIEADKAVRDEKRAVTIYTGDVHMRQGSMELDADSLTIFHVSDDIDKIVARGEPAKMRQRPELDKGLVHAHARTITYYKEKQLVHLQTDARVERDNDLVTGDSIDYFITREVIKAQADQSGDGDRKVQVVIQPATAQPEQAPGPADPNAPPPAAAQTPGTATQEAAASGATQGE